MTCFSLIAVFLSGGVYVILQVFKALTHYKQDL